MNKNIYMVLIRCVFIPMLSIVCSCFFFNKTCFISNTVNDSLCFRSENVFRTFLKSVIILLLPVGIFKDCGVAKLNIDHLLELSNEIFLISGSLNYTQTSLH